MIKSFLVMLLLLKTVGLFGQTLTNFTYSDCLQECIGDSSKIQSIVKTNEHTEIKLRTYAPCGGKFKGEYKLSLSGILDLRFSIIPVEYKNKEGEEYELLEVADCNCIFDFTYEFIQLKDIDEKSITVNGKTLLEINQQNQMIEITIESDSTK